MSRSFPTRIDISEENRGALAELLDQAYAGTVDLRSQCKQAQWTVRGPGCLALQDLFSEMAERLFEHGDLLARRSASLGGYPRVTVRAVAENSILPEYDEDATSAIEHLEALADRYELHAANLRRFIDVATQMEEPGTSMLLTDVCREVEADLWRLDSRLTEVG